MLTIVSQIMACVQSLAISLQKSSLDIVEGYRNIESVWESPRELRRDAGTVHSKCFEEAALLVSKPMTDIYILSLFSNE